MPRLTYLVGCSIDGYIADADGSLAPFFPLPDGLVAYLVEHFPQTLPTHLHSALGVTDLGDRFDAVVMGRGTYAPGVAEGVTSPYSHLRQYVVSGELVSPDPDVTVVSTDPVDAVRALKREPGGGIWLAGGGRLAATLLPEVDELVLKVYPFVLGRGIGVFDGAVTPTALTLSSSHVLDSGAVIQTYTR